MKNNLFYAAIITIVLPLKAIPVPFSHEIHRYFWANYNQFKGNVPVASTWYKHVISHNSSIYRYKGFIHFLAQMNRYPEIIALKKKIGTTFDTDPEIQLLFVQALRKTGANAEADSLIIALAERFNNHVEIVFEAAKTHIARKELENALAVIDKLINTSHKKNTYFVFYFLKAQIYTHLNQKEDALKNINESIALNPGFDKGWLLKAIMHEQQGNLGEAIQGYQQYITMSPAPDILIQQHLIELSFHGLQQKKIQQNNPLAPSIDAYARALYFFNRKQYLQALPFIQKSLKKDLTNGDYHTLLVQTLTALERYNELAQAIIAWVKVDPKSSAPLELLHLLFRTGTPVEQIIPVIEEVHAMYPSSEKPPLYLADLYTRNGNKEKAIVFHQKAMTHTTLSETIRNKIQFQLALLFYETKRFDEMLTVINSLHSKKKPHPALLNLLAYYYATEKQDLPQAQQYITQALALSPNNPHFLDTQATIYIAQKEYTKAHDILVPLAKEHPHDSTIIANLATTHAHLGNTDLAIQLWKDTLQLANTTEEKATIQQYIERINKK